MGTDGILAGALGNEDVNSYTPGAFTHWLRDASVGLPEVSFGLGQALGIWMD